MLSNVYMTKKERAINLRKKGKTCGEITTILNVPKSTAWSWIKNLVLSEKIKKQILKKSQIKWRKNINKFNKVNAKIRSEEAKKIRDADTSKGKKEIYQISKKELLLIGASLFWAEGSKSHRWHLCFANSDPEIIRVMMRFFREICHISDEKIKGLVHIYPGLNYKKVLNFWTKITNLSQNNFYKPQIQISRSSKGKRDRNTLPYGTLHLTAGNTVITSRVKGWIQGISEKI